MSVLRIPVHAGFSCPNRDGAISTVGCSFCDNRSFSPAAIAAEPAIDQLHAGIRRTRGYGAYIAYLQPFSNTHGTVDQLRSVYEALIAVPGVVGLAVGTRPDCLPPGVCEYLADVNRRTYLCVELGLQSGHDATLLRVNRGHSVADFVHAVDELHKRGIEIAAHVILGLPGEDRGMMRATARLLASLPVTGVKIHQLMIVKGTALEREYREGLISVLSLDEYAGHLGDFLACLRPDQLVHRIVAESSRETGLIAPAWSADKTAAIAYIHRALCSREIKEIQSR
jgi:hypothetical protein